MTHENGNVILSSAGSHLSGEANDCYMTKVLEIGLEDPQFVADLHVYCAADLRLGGRLFRDGIIRIIPVKSVLHIPSMSMDSTICHEQRRH